MIDLNGIFMNTTNEKSRVDPNESTPSSCKLARELLEVSGIRGLRTTTDALVRAMAACELGLFTSKASLVKVKDSRELLDITFISKEDRERDEQEANYMEKYKKY